MLASELEARGYSVDTWAPSSHVYNWVPRGRLSKWAGYVDQYLIFPWQVRRALRRDGGDTLYVFCDQALGPWVPLIKHLPHVVHCHDLLALRSALGDVPENPTAFTGKLYQHYIRWGFRQARHFIRLAEIARRLASLRRRACTDIRSGLQRPELPIRSVARNESRCAFEAAGMPFSERGMLLHVGDGRNWYKNTVGVIHLYAQYASQSSDPLPLWLVTASPNAAVRAALRRVLPRGEVLFYSGLDDRTLQAAYSQARALLFLKLPLG